MSTGIEAELVTLSKSALRIADALERIADAINPQDEDSIGIWQALVSIDGTMEKDFEVRSAGEEIAAAILTVANRIEDHRG